MFETTNQPQTWELINENDGGLIAISSCLSYPWGFSLFEDSTTGCNVRWCFILSCLKSETNIHLKTWHMRSQKMYSRFVYNLHDLVRYIYQKANGYWRYVMCANLATWVTTYLAASGAFFVHNLLVVAQTEWTPHRELGNPNSHCVDFENKIISNNLAVWRSSVLLHDFCIYVSISFYPIPYIAFLKKVWLLDPESRTPHRHIRSYKQCKTLNIKHVQLLWVKI